MCTAISNLARVDLNADVDVTSAAQGLLMLGLKNRQGVPIIDGGVDFPWLLERIDNVYPEGVIEVPTTRPKDARLKFKIGRVGYKWGAYKQIKSREFLDSRGVVVLAAGKGGAHSNHALCASGGYDAIDECFICSNSWGDDLPNPRVPGETWPTVLAIYYLFLQDIHIKVNSTSPWAKVVSGGHLVGDFARLRKEVDGHAKGTQFRITAGTTLGIVGMIGRTPIIARPWEVEPAF